MYEHAALGKSTDSPRPRLGSATIDRGRRTSVSSVSIILQAWINFSTFPMAIGGRRGFCSQIRVDMCFGYICFFVGVERWKKDLERE